MESLEHDQSSIEKVASFYNGFLNAIIIIACLGFIFIFGYVVFDDYLLKREASARTGLMDSYINQDGSVDFDTLKAINPDIVAWIKINDTNIDFPVVRGKDNYNYLYHDYKNERASVGAIFLDYRNSVFEDDFSVVYGHRMKGEYMFGSILKYADRDFFNQHRSGKLFTENTKYDLNIIGYAKVSRADTLIYGLDKSRNDKNEEIIKYFGRRSSTILVDDYGEKYNDEKLVVLSTCDGSSGQYRNALIAVLSEE